MGTLVAILLLIGAVIRPISASNPDLELAISPSPPPASMSGITTSLVLSDAGQGGQMEEAVTTPTPARTAVESFPGLRSQGGGITATTPTSQSAESGPRELTLWDGLAVPVSPAELHSDAVGYRWHLPRRGLGWHPNTPDCGGGVTVIGGHIAYDGAPGPLEDLTTIGPDDAVECVDGGGETHRYAPRDYLVGALEDDVEDWYPGWEQALILYTCTPELNDQLLVVRFGLLDTE